MGAIFPDFLKRKKGRNKTLPRETSKGARIYIPEVSCRIWLKSRLCMTSHPLLSFFLLFPVSPAPLLVSLGRVLFLPFFLFKKSGNIAPMSHF